MSADLASIYRRDVGRRTATLMEVPEIARAFLAYDRAIELTTNPAETRFLARQREVLTAG